MITHIEQNLHELTTIHKRLRELAEQKKEAIMARNMPELSAVIEKENESLHKAEQLETDRARLFIAFARLRGVVADEMTAAQLLNLVQDKAERNRVQHVLNELEEVIIDLQNANALNQRLVQDSLADINHTIDLMTALQKETGTYHRPTKANNQEKGPHTSRGFFDTRA